MRSLSFSGLAALIVAASSVSAQQGTPAPAQSPASRRPPATAVAQSYSAEEIQTGQSRFASQCGFCHGRDAQGGESGPDLTRSPLVSEDVRGDRIGPVIRSGRPEKDMPAFTLPDADIAAIVAFIHDAKSKAESVAGGRRSVDAADLETGDAEAGNRYFTGVGGCIKCHSLTGPFANVGSRYQGLRLLERMLYPRGVAGSRGAPFLPPVTITTVAGEKIGGKLLYRDEFTVTLIDSEGWSRSWPAAAVKVEGEDPLQAHTGQLTRYTDQEIHDVLAFLEALK